MSLPDWQEIDTVLLDMDGTLLDLHFDNYFWLEHMPTAYAIKQGVSRTEALQELNKSFQGLRGTLNWYCLDYWSELTGLSIIELKREITDKIQFRPHTRTFLEQLGNAGKRRMIVTNAHRDSVDLKFSHTGLETLVDRVISSHDYREPKETQAFWDHLHKNEPFDPARTLLIDDSLPVLESAQRWGMTHVLAIFQPDSQKQAVVSDQFPGILDFDELNEPDS